MLIHPSLPPVQDEIWCDASQQPVNQAGDLAASDYLRIDEVAMDVEEQVHDLRGVHALLNITGQCHLVDAALVWIALQVVLEAELRRLVLHTEVRGDDDGARGQ